MKTELQFCGLMMGDHCKSGINTMFNTATVADAFAVVFGGGYQRNYIPAFSWGGEGKYETYQLDKAIETAERVMQRRNIAFSVADREILSYLFEITRPTRSWDRHNG
jgi:hypothetical protein